MHRSFQLAWLSKTKRVFIFINNVIVNFVQKKNKVMGLFWFWRTQKSEHLKIFLGFFFGQNFTTFKLYFRTTSTSLFILKIKSVEFILFLLYEFIHVHSNEIYRCIFLLNAKWNCKIRSFPMWATLKGNSFSYVDANSWLFTWW